MIDKIKKTYFLSIDLDKLNPDSPAAAVHMNGIIDDKCISFDTYNKHTPWASGIEYSIEEYPHIKIIDSTTGSSISYKTNLTDDIKKAMFKIDNTNIQDKALFRYPNLTLPRMKVDLLKEKYNIKIIRDVDKSDYQIISDKSIENLFEYAYIKVFKPLDIKEWVDNTNTFNKETGDKIRNFLSKIEDDSYIHVHIHCIWGSIYKTIESALNSNLGKIENFIEYPYIILDYPALKNMMQSTTLILDKDVIKICGEDSVIVDQEQYNSLRNMLESDDAENLMLGLEIMSNCNIDKSLDKLAMLFFKFGDKLRYTKNWNTVNVKTFRNCFIGVPMKSEHNVHLYQYERLMEFLNKNDSITEFIYKALIQDISETVFEKIGLSQSQVFSLDINSIKLKEEYKIKPLQIVDDLPF